MPRLKAKHYEPPTPPDDRGRAELVKYIRAHTGRGCQYTMADLADAMGLLPGSLSARLNGNTNFTHGDLCRLFRLLEVPGEMVPTFFGLDPNKGQKSA